jgi:uncharacterized protein YfaS (alpha-2-macroglobulin family)
MVRGPYGGPEPEGEGKRRVILLRLYEPACKASRPVAFIGKHAEDAMRTTACGIALAIVLAGCAAKAGSMAARAPEATAVEGAGATAIGADDELALGFVERHGEPPEIDATALNNQKSGDWAAVREFAVASYDPDDTGPRSDFRETIFWSPSVKTGPDGRATLEFPTSDAITGFRVIAEGVEGGAAGHGEAAFASRLPVSLAANLPVEVTRGDRIALPVTITNNTREAVDAVVTAKTGAALAIAGDATRTIRVPARGVKTMTYKLAVEGAEGAGGAGDISIAITAGAASDALRRSLKIVPNGFPGESSVAGTVEGKARHAFTIPDGVVPGSVHTAARIYPSPVAAMTIAADSMIREPGGCFEQASATNYPNVMVLRYLGATGADPSSELAARASSALDRGYALLTGYESPSKGYEWFGGDPGHEALTAYGLLEFREMQKVYPEVDQKMVDRTHAWLHGRRDGKGGFHRDHRTHNIGLGNQDIDDAYITYALAESGERDLAAEIAHVKDVGGQTRDPYLLALAAAGVLAYDANDSAGKAMLGRLAKLQAADGRFPGATTTVTGSGGQALEIETAALAAIAMMKAGSAYDREIGKALEWLKTQKDQWGGYASTQATILALQALTARPTSNQIPAGTTITIALDGTDVATIAVDANADGAIELPDLGAHLSPGEHVIELRPSKGAKLEYSLGVTWYDAAPVASSAAPIAVHTSLDKKRLRVGRPLRLTATVENTTATGQPMTIARLGIPGGVKYQPWQLDELVAKKAVDYIETREREVILYFRGMAPREKRKVAIELLAQVPGTYAAAPSSAYLYYTDELRDYERPLAVEVQKPAPKKKKKPAVASTAAGSVP